MKKVLKSALMFAAASLVFAGCSKDVAEDITPEVSGNKITISGTVLAPGETRVAGGGLVDGKYAVNWVTGDEFALLEYVDGEAYYDTKANTENPAYTAVVDAANSSFTAEVDEKAGSEYQYYAVYPKSAFYNLTDPSFINVTFPYKQSPTADFVDPAAALMVAHNEVSAQQGGHVTLGFQHLAAYAKMTVNGLASGETPTTVTFTADVNITGGYYYYLNGTANDSEAAQHKEVVITVPADVTVSGGSFDVWFTVKPDVATQIGSFTVAVETDKGNTYTAKAETNGALKFSAGKIMPFTVNVSPMEKTVWNGDYLILINDTTNNAYFAASGEMSNTYLPAEKFEGYTGSETEVSTDNKALIWNIQNIEGSTYSITYNGKYLNHTGTGNSANLNNSEAKYLTIEQNADGTCDITYSSDELRVLAYNYNNGSNPRFAFYKSASTSQPRNLILVPAKYTGSTTPEPTPGEVKTVSVAEFNAAAESQTQVYQLTGVVSGDINTTYGNFDLVDDSGSVYVYGLTATELGYGASNDKSYGSLGIDAGDKITIKGYRGSYGDKIEVMYAWFVELVEKGPGTTPEEPEDPEEESVYELVTNLSGIVSGGEYIFVATCSSDDAVVTLPNKSASSSINGELVSNTDFEISGNTLTTSSKNYTWVFNGSTNSMNIVSAKDETLYLGWSGSSTGMAVKSDSFSWTIEYSGNFLFSGSCGTATRYIGIYHNNNHPWRLYTSLTQDGVSYTVQLYKKK